MLAGGRGPPSVRDGLATVPFDWDLVDAYQLMERFAPLRTVAGTAPSPPPRPRPARGWRGRCDDGTGVQTVILHPFLMLDEAWREQAQRLLGQLAPARRATAAPGSSPAVSLRRRSARHGRSRVRAMSSATRIPTTHVGSLPRPQEVVDLVFAQDRGESVDPDEFDRVIGGAVRDRVAAPGRCRASTGSPTAR